MCRNTQYKLGQKVEVELSCDFLVYPFIYVVVLVRRLTFSSLEVFIKLTDVFEKQMESLFYGVINNSDRFVPLRNTSWEGRWPDEHALKQIDYLNLEFRVRNALIDREEDVKNICLVLSMRNTVELCS